METFDPPGPVCMISPHLDDVVLSCSNFLQGRPGTTVVTVFAGLPDGPAGAWDHATTGESDAGAAVSVRRREDARAMATLRATPVWLDICGGQYDDERRQVGPLLDVLRGALEEVRPASVVAPLGIHHPDHVAVSDACLALGAGGDIELYCYSEVPYVRTFPDEVEGRVELLAERVHELKRCREFEPRDPGFKAEAVAAYGSQIPQLKAAHSAFEESLADPEQYWRVVPINPGR